MSNFGIAPGPDLWKAHAWENLDTAIRLDINALDEAEADKFSELLHKERLKQLPGKGGLMKAGFSFEAGDYSQLSDHKKTEDDLKVAHSYYEDESGSLRKKFTGYRKRPSICKSTLRSSRKPVDSICKSNGESTRFPYSDSV